MKLISEILLVAGPLDEAMEAFNRGLPDDMDRRAPIADLSPAQRSGWNSSAGPALLVQGETRDEAIVLLPVAAYAVDATVLAGREAGLGGADRSAQVRRQGELLCSLATASLGRGRCARRTATCRRPHSCRWERKHP